LAASLLTAYGDGSNNEDFEIAATNDFIDSVNGNTGINAVINILRNNSLGGNQVTTANIHLTEKSSHPEGALSLNTNGDFNVKENTAYGSYSLSYLSFWKLQKKL